MIDALVKAVASRGPVCVGLDTSMNYIPESMLCDDVTETCFDLIGALSMLRRTSVPYINCRLHTTRRKASPA